MTRPVRLRWLRVSTLWVYRAVAWSVLAAGLVCAGVVLALRYWVLPNIEHYRDDIARIVSEKARQKITIGRISANWDGLRPQLMLEQVTVHDAAGRPALELSRVDNTLVLALARDAAAQVPRARHPLARRSTSGATRRASCPSRASS